MPRPGRVLAKTIGHTGYLSMNTAAWQPPRTVVKTGEHAVKFERQIRFNGGMMPAMADPTPVSTPLRVLVSEGNSTSAREAVTILGLAGHHVEVCDPSRFGLARFSRFVDKWHRCPGLRDDPAGFVSFVERLLTAKHFDVLLPIHEQGFAFARVQQRLAGHVGLALPAFENYRTAHSKAGFSRLLDLLGLPQPATWIVTSAAELREAVRFPCFIKTSVGTASRGIWLVRNDGDLERALADLGASGGFADEVLAQDFVAGATEKAQAIFCHGELLGFHAYRQIVAGAGGGEAIKQSVIRPQLRAQLADIGRHLAWHGALSVDCVVPEDGTTPLLIDCNPRLVEPMSAYLAGVDLVALLLKVSQGKTPAMAPPSRDRVRTHLAMQALLGCALRGGSRRDVLRESWRLLRGDGPYAGSVEELTPIGVDWISAVPLAVIALSLLLAPRLASVLAKSGWGAHLLDLASVRRIESEDFR
jgi:predicted ATP-grasp superfamily ATP-dependent carboligase